MARPHCDTHTPSFFVCFFGGGGGVSVSVPPGPCSRLPINKSTCAPSLYNHVTNRSLFFFFFFTAPGLGLGVCFFGRFFPSLATRAFLSTRLCVFWVWMAASTDDDDDDNACHHRRPSLLLLLLLGFGFGFFPFDLFFRCSSLYWPSNNPYTHVHRW